ncbi:MAG: hypothetical protein RL226_1846 [Bacteroidota bacterium]
MVTTEQADALLKSFNLPVTTETVSIELAYGRVLAEDVLADRDQPPFDRVTMDGIAVRRKDLDEGLELFTVLGQQFAGDEPALLTEVQGAAIETATGASLPLGADMVLPYEWLEREGDLCKLNRSAIGAKSNVHRRGNDLKQGEIALKADTLLGSAELAVAASFGAMNLTVYALPKLAVITTGNELVAVHEQPKPHQIRQSNATAITALLAEEKYSFKCFHLTDNKDDIRSKLKSLFNQFDVLIFSGGVSKGKHDHLPELLQEVGVKPLFHGVSQRPGKPMFCGTADTKIVFGLPGNPVSAFMCSVRYVLPWLNQQLRKKSVSSSAVLTCDHHFEPALTLFVPVKTKTIDGQVVATPVQGNGSGDFMQLAGADGFLELDKESTTFEKGTAFPFYPFR